MARGRVPDVPVRLRRRRSPADAASWARVFGVGPFHVFPRIETPCWYRGTEIAVDMQIAVAQAGPVQIELIQQHCDRPSVYRELVGEGSSGSISCARSRSDYDGKKAGFEELGYTLVSELFVRGQHVGYFDTVRRLRLLHRAGRGRPRLRRRAHPDLAAPAPSGTAPIPSASSPATATARRRASRSRGGRLHAEQHRRRGLEHAADGVGERRRRPRRPAPAPRPRSWRIDSCSAYMPYMPLCV